MKNFMSTILSAFKDWTKTEIKDSTADWNQNDSSANNYVKNRTHWTDDNGVVHTLDEKYIPDSIARVDNIPEINYPVTSVNGMTGDVVVVIPEQKDITVNGVAPDENGNIEVEVGGGVSSWNDLTDKPFGEEGSGATIEWDGNTEGRECVLYDETSFCYVSELTPSVNDLEGCTVVTCTTEGIYEDVLTQENEAFEQVNNVTVVGGIVYVAHKDNAEYDGTIFPIAGVYFYKYDEGNMYVSKLTYGSTTIKTLDEKFIPDTIARTEDLNAPKTELILTSSTSGSTKQFKITIDDEGVLTATEIVESTT